MPTEGRQFVCTIDEGECRLWDRANQQYMTCPRAVPAGGDLGQALVKASGADQDVRWSDVGAVTMRSFGIVIDGGGSPISTGFKGFIQIPFAGVILRWTMMADQPGSIVIDVWKDTFTNAPPTVADSIVGSEKPTLSGAQFAEDTDLTTWTTTVAAGDVVGFNVDSVATIQRVTLSVWVASV